MTEVLAHSPLGASSMYRWSKCPGSIRISKGLPNISSVYAEEGTKAHELAAYVLSKGEYPADIESYPDDMLQAVDVFIHEALRHSKGGKKDWIEERFDLSSVYPGMFGTADYVCFDHVESVLYVDDYKHGAGVAVEVEDNFQGLYYGLGALICLKLPAKFIDIGIIQPRCPHPDGPVRRWRISAIEMLDFEADLVAFAKATEDPNAPLNPGDHCRFCPAAASCPALEKQALVTAQQDFAPDKPYEPASLAETLTKVDRIESWCKAVRSFAYMEAERGRVPPGYKFVAKQSRRKWAKDVNPHDITLSLPEGVEDEDLYQEPKLLSPAQVEKKFGLTKADKEVLKNFWIAESSGNKLVKMAGDGKEITSGPDADFKKVESIQDVM